VSHEFDSVRFRFRFRYVLHPWTAKYSHWMRHEAIVCCKGNVRAMPYESVSEWVVCSHRREQYKDGQHGPQETRAVEGLVIRNRVTTNRCASRDVRVLGTPNRPDVDH
jgi:hypothetical protein